MKLTLNVFEKRTEPKDKGWPSHVFGGRIRTSTLLLIVAFLAVWWVYDTYRPQPPPKSPPSQVVPPGFVPDPNYTWVPRSRVQQPPTATYAPTPTTTVPPTPTTTVPVPTTTTTAPSSQPTTVVVKPLAKLAHGAPWKTSRMQLGMQTDGNLVLYDLVGKRPLWAAGTSGAGNTAYFQTDGNLVVYTADHHAIWASDASGFTDATLVLRSDGNMLIMAGTKQVWSTNTHF